MLNRWVISGDEGHEKKAHETDRGRTWCKSEDVAVIEKRLKKSESIIFFANEVFGEMNTTNATLKIIGLVDLLNKYVDENTK